MAGYTHSSSPPFGLFLYSSFLFFGFCDFFLFFLNPIFFFSGSLLHKPLRSTNVSYRDFPLGATAPYKQEKPSGEHCSCCGSSKIYMSIRCGGSLWHPTLVGCLIGFFCRVFVVLICHHMRQFTIIIIPGQGDPLLTYFSIAISNEKGLGAHLPEVRSISLPPAPYTLCITSFLASIWRFKLSTLIPAWRYTC